MMPTHLTKILTNLRVGVAVGRNQPKVFCFMTYEEQLKDRRWFLFRTVILLRDGERCVKCGSYRNLQAHHLYYESGKMAWEYPFEACITLCDLHHSIEHGKLNYHHRYGDFQSIGSVIHDIAKNMGNNGK